MADSQYVASKEQIELPGVLGQVVGTVADSVSSMVDNIVGTKPTEQMTGKSSSAPVPPPLPPTRIELEKTVEPLDETSEFKTPSRRTPGGLPAPLAEGSVASSISRNTPPLEQIPPALLVEEDEKRFPPGKPVSVSTPGAPFIESQAQPTAFEIVSAPTSKIILTKQIPLQQQQQVSQIPVPPPLPNYNLRHGHFLTRGKVLHDINQLPKTEVRQELMSEIRQQPIRRLPQDVLRGLETKLMAKPTQYEIPPAPRVPNWTARHGHYLTRANVLRDIKQIPKSEIRSEMLKQIRQQPKLIPMGQRQFVSKIPIPPPLPSMQARHGHFLTRGKLLHEIQQLPKTEVREELMSEIRQQPIHHIPRETLEKLELPGGIPRPPRVPPVYNAFNKSLNIPRKTVNIPTPPPLPSWEARHGHFLSSGSVPRQVFKEQPSVIPGTSSFTLVPSFLKSAVNMAEEAANRVIHKVEDVASSVGQIITAPLTSEEYEEEYEEISERTFTSSINRTPSEVMEIENKRKSFVLDKSLIDESSIFLFRSYPGRIRPATYEQQLAGQSEFATGMVRYKLAQLLKHYKSHGMLDMSITSAAPQTQFFDPSKVSSGTDIKEESRMMEEMIPQQNVWVSKTAPSAKPSSEFTEEKRDSSLETTSRIAPISS